MEIKYYTAPCGAGKSFQAAQRMINQPSRYVVVRDRIEAMTEYASQLYTMAQQAGVNLPIATISAEKGESVRLRVEEVPERFATIGHVIVLITHKALMMCDFSNFADWSIIIDETPVVLDRQDLKTSQSRAFFERNYDLERVKRGWSAVTLSHDGWNITPADLEADDCFRMLRVFHERVTAATPEPEQTTSRIARRAHDGGQRAVIGSLEEWRDMDDGRRWTWWSLWSPRQLAAFDSVEFMANGFDKSVTFELLRSLNPGITWTEVETPHRRTFEPRRVAIEYYAQQPASFRLFATEKGRVNLAAIARHHAGRDQIWMANDSHAEYLAGIGGRQLRPHQAGSNQYAAHHAATALYAAKPSGETRAILDLLGVATEAWTRSYEFEAILQFVCRTSVRDPASTAPVLLSVYDEAQAAYLASYFRDQPHCDVEVRLVDLGFAQDRAERGGRPALARNMSVEEAEARKVAMKAKRAEAARQRRAREKAVTV